MNLSPEYDDSDPDLDLGNKIRDHIEGVVDTDKDAFKAIIDSSEELKNKILGSNVVEFGSGNGDIAFLFAEYGAKKVTGVEPYFKAREKSELESIKLGFEENVKFIGNEDSAEIDSLFAEADVIYSYPLQGEMTNELLNRISKNCQVGTLILINVFTNNFGIRIQELDQGSISPSPDETEEQFRQRLSGYHILKHSKLKIKGWHRQKHESGEVKLLVLEVQQDPFRLD